ncbi:c-type cytochrome [Metallibacterium sp.]
MKPWYSLHAFIIPLIVFGTLAPKAGIAGDAKKGAAIYSQSCVACHGIDGKGSIPGAPDLMAKNGVLKSPDSVLIERITNGYQSKGSPMAMPPKGGNSSLTTQDISDVLAYIRQRFGGTDKR